MIYNAMLDYQRVLEIDGNNGNLTRAHAPLPIRRDGTRQSRCCFVSVSQKLRYSALKLRRVSITRVTRVTRVLSLQILWPSLQRLAVLASCNVFWAVAWYVAIISPKIPGFWPKRTMIGTVWNGSHWMWTLMIWCLISFDVCCICKYLVLRSNQYIHEVRKVRIPRPCFPVFRHHVIRYIPVIAFLTSHFSQQIKWRYGIPGGEAMDGDGTRGLMVLGDDRLNLVCCHTYSVIVCISCVV